MENQSAWKLRHPREIPYQVSRAQFLTFGTFREVHPTYQIRHCKFYFSYEFGMKNRCNYIKKIFCKLFTAYVIDNEDGTFTVSYQPIVRGAHQIKITMRNININGSPFTVNVTGRMDFAKVGKVLACFGCEGSGGGKD